MIISWDSLRHVIGRQQWWERIEEVATENPPKDLDGISVILSEKGQVDVVWDGQHGRAVTSFLYFNSQRPAGGDV